MFEALYNEMEDKLTSEPKSVMEFLDQCVHDGDTEEKFLITVHDARHQGFIAGLQAAMSLVRGAA